MWLVLIGPFCFSSRGRTILTSKNISLPLGPQLSAQGTETKTGGVAEQTWHWRCVSACPISICKFSSLTWDSLFIRQRPYKNPQCSNPRAVGPERITCQPWKSQVWKSILSQLSLRSVIWFTSACKTELVNALLRPTKKCETTYLYLNYVYTDTEWLLSDHSARLLAFYRA